MIRKKKLIRKGKKREQEKAGRPESGQDQKDGDLYLPSDPDFYVYIRPCPVGRRAGAGTAGGDVGNGKCCAGRACCRAGRKRRTCDGAGAGSQEAESQEGLILNPEDMWCLILTNAQYPIPEDYLPVLKEVPGQGQSVDERIYDPLMEMLSDMKEQGLSPVVCSGYRTLDKQEMLFNRKVSAYVKQGYSMEEANQMARRLLSIPGSGEHCLGLAVDIYCESYQKLEAGFAETKEGKWLREHCWDYGFILRYDQGKEELTGIDYEPWHFRYVGKAAAQYLKETGMCLEEFYIEESLYG